METKYKIKRTHGSYFNALDWQDIDMKINGNKTYIVRAFGRDDCGMSHCWTVIGFQPYFYIKFEDNEIGDFKNIRDFYYNKNQKKHSRIVKMMMKRMID